MFWLRNYPPLFGDAVCGLRRELLDTKTNNHGNLLVSKHASYRFGYTPLGPETMEKPDRAADEEGLFSYAGFASVCNYARACKRLKLPGFWKRYFPHTVSDPPSFEEAMMEQMENIWQFGIFKATESEIYPNWMIVFVFFINLIGNDVRKVGYDLNPIFFP